MMWKRWMVAAAVTAMLTSSGWAATNAAQPTKAAAVRTCPMGDETCPMRSDAEARPEQRRVRGGVHGGLHGRVKP